MAYSWHTQYKIDYIATNNALACCIVHCYVALSKPIRHTGVAGAVILPVAGLGVGVAQVIRGAANTPEAIKESRQGRYWDQVC